MTHPLYTSKDEGATTEVVTPKKKNHKRGSRGKWSKRGSQSKTCDSGSETASLSSSTGVANSPAGWRHSKKEGGVNMKSTSQSLMVKPATLRVRAGPSADGPEVSPTIGTTMRMSTSWPRSLEL